VFAFIAVRRARIDGAALGLVLAIKLEHMRIRLVLHERALRKGAQCPLDII
jgi:hypothetical protein